MGKCDSYTRMLQMNPPLDHRRCLQGNWCFSPPASMRSRLASGIFKMASEAFIGDMDKKFRIHYGNTALISWIWRF